MLYPARGVLGVFSSVIVSCYVFPPPHGAGGSSS